MHICFITIDYPSPGYPVYTFVEQLCIELAKQGHEISVVAPQNIVSILTGKRRKVDFIRKQQYGDGKITIYSPYSQRKNHLFHILDLIFHDLFRFLTIENDNLFLFCFW